MSFQEVSNLLDEKGKLDEQITLLTKEKTDLVDLLQQHDRTAMCGESMS